MLKQAAYVSLALFGSAIMPALAAPSMIVGNDEKPAADAQGRPEVNPTGNHRRACRSVRSATWHCSPIAPGASRMVFMPDCRHALALKSPDNKGALLAIDAGTVSYNKVDIRPILSPTTSWSHRIQSSRSPPTTAMIVRPTATSHT